MTIVVRNFRPCDMSLVIMRVGQNEGHIYLHVYLPALLRLERGIYTEK